LDTDLINKEEPTLIGDLHPKDLTLQALISQVTEVLRRFGKQPVAATFKTHTMAVTQVQAFAALKGSALIIGNRNVL
jgi:hypothetical protein